MQTRLQWQLHKISFLLEKKADEQLKQSVGIGYAQYKVLEAIYQHDLTKQNVVAALLDQTEASISRQVKILQSKGLITVKEVMGNKRARELSLTRVGEEVIRQSALAVEEAQGDSITQLNYQEQSLMLEMLERMLDKLQ